MRTARRSLPAAPPGFVTTTVRDPTAAAGSTTRRTAIRVAVTDCTAQETPLPSETDAPLAKRVPVTAMYVVSPWLTSEIETLVTAGAACAAGSAGAVGGAARVPTTSAADAVSCRAARVARVVVVTGTWGLAGHREHADRGRGAAGVAVGHRDVARAGGRAGGHVDAHVHEEPERRVRPVDGHPCSRDREVGLGERAHLEVLPLHDHDPVGGALPEL